MALSARQAVAQLADAIVQWTGAAVALLKVSHPPAHLACPAHPARLLCLTAVPHSCQRNDVADLHSAALATAQACFQAAAAVPSVKRDMTSGVLSKWIAVILDWSAKADSQVRPSSWTRQGSACRH